MSETPPIAEPEELLEVAVIIGTHGVRGQMRARVFLDNPYTLLDFGQLLWAKGSPAPAITIEGESRGALILRMANVSGRTAAEKMKGKKLLLPISAFPALEDEDEFYTRDLIGLDVIDGAGTLFGTIALVADYGAGDVIEIKRSDTGKLLVLPFTKALFPKVDIQARQVTCLDPGEEISQDEDGAVH